MIKVSEIIFYATSKDIEIIQQWINSETQIAWIVKESEFEKKYTWRAVNEINKLKDGGTYSIWHVNSNALVIPSESTDTTDVVVTDPFKSWSQTLKYENATDPWFGKITPTLFFLTFSEKGHELPNSIGRSGFGWLADRYKSLGRPAHPEAKLWWKKLQRFITKNSVSVPWGASGQYRAYIFPDAFIQHEKGRHLDINP